jgi:SNF2 family DNA or RNA helicase
LPDPVKFLALLDPAASSSSDTAAAAAATANTTKLFFGKGAKSGNNNNNKPTIYQQAAFGLLQWAHHGETFDFQTAAAAAATTAATSSSSSTNSEGGSSDESGGEEEQVLMEDNEDYNPADDEEKAMDNALAKDIVVANNNSAVLELKELEAPADFKVTLRPYQRQALWWMTQREGQEELEDSSRQQLELLEELVQSTSSTTNTPQPTTSSVSSTTPIHCECGPVQVDTTSIQAPAVLDALHYNGDESSRSNPDLKHPLWERRYLTDSSQTKALSFYVQPLFGAAMATPPPPPRPCRGGILADSMGLGKTIMLLALIQSGLEKPRTTNSRKTTNGPSTTLIVSPLSLLAQWQEEIESKTTMTHRVYYGDKRQLDDDTFDNVDIVLTTYGSLQGEWLAHSKQLQKEQDDDGPNDTVGGLVGHAWKRVILDEAHCIKNTATVASRACCLLQAERRWCVSGTIIQNSLDDVYSLLKFLRHEPWCQPSFWKTAISAPLRSNDTKQQALDRVRRLLTPIMLRRTKESVDKDGYVLGGDGFGSNHCCQVEVVVLVVVVLNDFSFPISQEPDFNSPSRRNQDHFGRFHPRGTKIL